MYPQNIDLPQTTPNFPKAKPQPTSSNNSNNSSPQHSLPCGQRTPAASTSSSDVPSTQTPYTSPHPPKQHTPSKTDLNRSSQFSITEEDQQHVPKSADGTKVKCSKQQMSACAFTAIYLATFSATVPNFHIALDVEQEDTPWTDV